MLGAMGAALQWRERGVMPLPRAGVMAGAVGERLLVAGGSYWEGNEKKFSARADWFEPKRSEWVAGPALPEARSDAAVVGVDGFGVVGGVVRGAVTDTALRLVEGAWREWPEGRLPEALAYGVGLTEGGKAYWFGGLRVVGDLTSATKAWRVLEAGKGWKDLAPFPGASRVTAGVVAHQGRVYVLGGVHQEAGQAIQNLNEVWVYDLARDVWEKGEKLPVARRACSAASTGRRVLLLGGYTEGFSAEVYSLEPGAGKWERESDLPHPIADGRFVWVGGKLWNAGGETGNKIRAPWTMEAGFGA